MRILLAAKRHSDIAAKWHSDIAAKWRKVIAMGVSPHLYPHLLNLLPSPWSRGEGLGVRGLHCVLIGFLIVNSMSSCVSEG